MSKVDLKRENEKHLKNKVGRRHRRNTKLQELERQLEFAESRCGTLKQQLDYIKLLYGCKRDPAIENHASVEEGHGDGSALNQHGFEFSKFPFQNENFANKDNGDCLEEVPRTISHSNTATSNSSHKFVSQEKCELKKKSPKIKTQKLKGKRKVGKKAKKRRRAEGGEVCKVSNASSQTPSQVWQDPLVEIYKNSALKVESESGFEFLGKNKLNRQNEVLSEVLRHKVSEKIGGCKQPQDIVKETKARSCNFLSSKKDKNFVKDVHAEAPFDQVSQNKQNEMDLYSNKENAQKTDSACLEPMKSYCQPTISSKRKRVEREIYSNLTNLNIRNIPFIAARSTAPSHNIGINIQQVLSIIKKRHPLSENFASAAEWGHHDNPLAALMTSRKIAHKAIEGGASAPATGASSCEDTKRRSEVPRSSLSYWKSNSEINKEKSPSPSGKSETENEGWGLKVDKLKKVLVFLHEDFTSLSQKYKRLQKKLTKRNITKTDAKDELADIEHDLEKKEEEIIVVIALYKEVLNLREELKKLREKYNTIICGRNLMLDGLKQSNSAHTQMTSLLRKIQNFQGKLKG